MWYKDGIVFVSDRTPGKGSTKTYQWTGRPFLDLYYSKDNGKGELRRTGITQRRTERNLPRRSCQLQQQRRYGLLHTEYVCGPESEEVRRRCGDLKDLPGHKERQHLSFHHRFSLRQCRL
ncbi:MAG: hypothetical protein IPF81_19315 [Bacteroidetes bacterium]|nr:hypothetical protein [Bacteroidota bacterium]